MGQTNNPQDHCRLANLLLVEEWFCLLEKLSKLKQSHPVQTAKFAVVQRIDHKPAFNEWVKHMLKKRDRIIESGTADI